MNKSKIYFIDNLRVLMIILVVLHHSFITYGAPGGWYFKEPTKVSAALNPMTFFVAVNQSFFMGFFFFLSALFIESSIEKKGTRLFVTDRLKRLGIPLIFYSLILSPLLSWLVEYYGYGEKISFGEYLKSYHHWIDFGVLWFVAALLLFTFIYVAIRPIIKYNPGKKQIVPRNGTILLFAVAIGILSYIVRIKFPVGWVLQPVGFQFAHFSQYISMFILGIVTSRKSWLTQFNVNKAKPFRIIGLAMIFIVFPMMFVIKMVTGCSIDAFSGGGTYQSFVSAVWEQLTGFSIVVVLLGYGSKKWNSQSVLLGKMSRSAYAVYIFHPLVLVSLALIFAGTPIDPAFKLLIVAPLAVVLSFIAGGFLIKIPGVRNII
jgi:hypothetical protein